MLLTLFEVTLQMAYKIDFAVLKIKDVYRV